MQFVLHCLWCLVLCTLFANGDIKLPKCLEMSRTLIVNITLFVNISNFMNWFSFMVWHLGWVYISVWVQQTWALKHPLMHLTFGHKIGPKLEDWFLQPGGVFSWVETNEIWQDSDVTFSATSWFPTLDADSSVNYLGQRFWISMIVQFWGFFGLAP